MNFEHVPPHSQLYASRKPWGDGFNSYNDLPTVASQRRSHDLQHVAAGWQRHHRHHSAVASISSETFGESARAPNNCM